jgi:hypothetical protein
MTDKKNITRDGFLKNARVYLSGPMDFVHCRKIEKETGWRVRVSQFLASLDITVFDPWSKPQVLGMHGYGREGEKTLQIREKWIFDENEEGRTNRKQCADFFRETMHLDLRMVDVSDFMLAFCPTNIYSVGTPHEIIVACEQHKPVLFITPPVHYPALEEMKLHLQKKNDQKGLELLDILSREVPIKENTRGIPSLWYMPLVGSENFFDGFGYDLYRDRFNWSVGPADLLERKFPPRRPLLKFLDDLDKSHEIPKKWDPVKRQMRPDDDWLLLDLKNHLR